MKKQIFYKWAVKWQQKNILDGKQEYFMFRKFVPVLFFTKKEAVDFIVSEYGYIAKRKDLRREPHGWRMPKPVKVKITIQEIK